MKKITFGFAGLGLIGGSIAKALRNVHPDCTIIAYDTNLAALDLAVKEGVVNLAARGLDQSFETCDYLFLCAPVSHNDNNLSQLSKHLLPACLITDVGSVKAPIHQTVSRLGLERQFIGGHPMTGSERTGFANAKAGLLENAYYILTPTPQVSAELVAQYQDLVAAMGALPLVLSYTEHDYVTAAVSHLPHVIAASLVRLVRDSDSSEGIMKMIAAGGFKDITRIASSSPTMWQQICMNNHTNISLLLEQYMNALASVNEEVKALHENNLYDFFEEARTYRDSFIDVSSGPIKKSHSIYVDIPDKAGALAAIVTLFADHDINIKNIGISHNRDQEEGVLRIEFYDENSITKSGRLLADDGYTFHTKN